MDSSGHIDRLAGATPRGKDYLNSPAERLRSITTSAIHIADYKGSIEMEVLISDRDYWKRRESGVVIRTQ